MIEFAGPLVWQIETTKFVFRAYRSGCFQAKLNHLQDIDTDIAEPSPFPTLPSALTLKELNFESVDAFSSSGNPDDKVPPAVDFEVRNSFQIFWLISFFLLPRQKRMKQNPTLHKRANTFVLPPLKKTA